MSSENGSAPAPAIYSADAEVGVLGGILIDRGAIRRTANILSSSDFFREQNRTIHLAMLRLDGRGDVIDVITIAEELKKTGEMEAAGGFDYLAALVDAVPSAVNIEHHADLVRERSRQRAVAALGRHLQKSAEAMEDPDEVLAEAGDAVRRAQRGGGGNFQILSESQLDQIPPTHALLGDILLQKTFVLMVGEPEAGKSLVALSMAESIHEGIKWNDHEVHRGPVVYVYAEGTGGLGPRVRAWRDYHQRPRHDEGVLFIPAAVNLLDRADVGRFLVDVERRLPGAPALFVFDTLARCMPGGDENNGADMGRVIASVDQVREETGATVLLLHHPNAGGQRERGHTSLKGAVDTQMELHVEGTIRVLRCKKQKDRPHFDPITMRIRGHAGSAVITPTRTTGVIAYLLTPSELETLRSLQANSLEEGLTATAWKEVASVDGSTFYNHRKSLHEKGLVERDRPGRGSQYTVTAKGQEALKGKLQ